MEFERDTRGESQGKYVQRLILSDPKLSKDSLKMIAKDAFEDAEFMARHNALLRSRETEIGSEGDNKSGN
jgi:hypothetical protein